MKRPEGTEEIASVGKEFVGPVGLQGGRWPTRHAKGPRCSTDMTV